MELRRSIEFLTKKHIKKPTSINKNKTVFVLYAPEKDSVTILWVKSYRYAN